MNLVNRVGFISWVVIIALLVFSLDIPVTKAADSDFSNGITVDSKLDTVDSNVGDNICDDGSGNCTLRAAIEESNATAGTQTIAFNISGTADFTNGGQNGYSIQPTSGLPNITDTTTIDGYTQPGAQANTAVAPQPLNGRLLIELRGMAGLGMPSMQANGSILRGLVINSFDSSGVIIWGDDIRIVGNYIGTDPTGMIARPNTNNGINGHASGTSDRAIIGSTNPADRNIISGNAGAGITPNTDQDDWVVKGNYIGLGADGVTQIGNSAPINGPGAMSIDNCSGTIVGGSELGAVNVISGNKNFGIFPDNTEGLVIQGNIIGPDWKGDPIPGNVQLGGIGLPALNGPFINTIIGGVNPGEGNLIAYNDGSGIAVIKVFISGISNFNPDKIAILGNSIYGNTPNGSYIISQSGLGIDLIDGEFTNMTSTTSGPTPNDTGDTDTGPNGYMNFPVLASVAQQDNNVAINYSLDALDSPTNQYRVEFFANDTADPSGYGEGQTYLGSTTTAPGTNLVANLTVPNGTNLNGKHITATTTTIDNTTTSGFGSTSEFSAVVIASAAFSPQLLTNNSLAATGDNYLGLRLLSLLIIILAAIGLSRGLHQRG